jgi:hypothetical protein
MDDVLNVRCVPKGAIQAFSACSRQKTDEVIADLKREKLVSPRVAGTGREHFSPREADLIWKKTGRL